MKAVVVGVDDDRRVLESIESLVASAGHIAVLFSSAEDCLQSGVLGSAACIIADVCMPGMDGLELQRRIRLERPALPVILISAHCDNDVPQRALQGGAKDIAGNLPGVHGMSPSGPGARRRKSHGKILLRLA
jgi:FixJ family two-component response regulator